MRVTAHGLSQASPEVEVLLRLARVRPCADDAARVGALTAGPFDWDALFALARHHRVSCLVHHGLQTTGPHPVPAAVRDHFRDCRREAAHRQLVLAGRLLRLLRGFRDEGLAAVAYKGPALAMQAYGDLGLREFDDLDVVVSARDFPRARAVLEAQGYRSLLSWSHSREADQVRAKGQLPFQAADGGVVELHCLLAPSNFRLFVDFEALHSRATAVALGGDNVPTFAPEDLMVLLAVHGAKHLWAQLRWICDLAELIRACPALNWPVMRTRACALRSERMWLLGLALAQLLLGVSLPQVVCQTIAAERRLPALITAVHGRLFGAGQRPVTSWDLARFHLGARDRWWDGARYALALLVTPSAADWDFLPLPRSLGVLHYLLRPLRLGLGLVRARNRC
jgi:hypothetical protein